MFRKVKKSYEDYNLKWFTDSVDKRVQRYMICVSFNKISDL